MNTFFFVIILVLLVSEIHNAIILWKIKKNGKGAPSSLNDERYFELKSRNQFIVAIGMILISIITYVGWDSIQGVKTDIESELTESRKNLTALNVEISDKLELIQNLENKIFMVDSLQKALKGNIDLKVNEVKQIGDEVDNINSEFLNFKKMIPIQFDIVFAYREHDLNFFSKVKFSDCINLNTNKKLEPFQKPVFVFISNGFASNVFYNIYRVEKDYFELQIKYIYDFGVDFKDYDCRDKIPWEDYPAPTDYLADKWKESRSLTLSALVFAY